MGVLAVSLLCCGSVSLLGVNFRVVTSQRKTNAPLCRYTGVTRKVPFKLRPKDRKKVSKILKKCRAPRGTKTEETEE